MESKAVKQKPETSKSSPDSVSNAIALWRKADADKEALPEFQTALDAEPKRYLCWGDVASNALIETLTSIAGEGASGTKELMTRKVADLRAEVAGPDPSPLERLLVERVVICWLQVYHADRVFANNVRTIAGTERIERIERWQERAQKRFLSAVKALAQVRKLEIPMVQVNIGERQVNIGTAGLRFKAGREADQTSDPAKFE